MAAIHAALTVERILAWADAHYRQTGTWPTHRTGAIPEAAGENWAIVEAALRLGLRGLPGGDTLRRLLTRECGQPVLIHLRDSAVGRSRLPSGT